MTAYPKKIRIEIERAVFDTLLTGFDYFVTKNANLILEVMHRRCILGIIPASQAGSERAA